jgi:hypothetical protein
MAIWFGMMWDCLFVSRLPLLSKISWFLLLLITNMLGGYSGEGEHRFRREGEHHSGVKVNSSRSEATLAC